MIDAYSNAPEWGSKFLNDRDHVRYLYYLNWILHVCVCVFACVCAPSLIDIDIEVTQSYPTLWPHELKPTRLLCPWNFPGKSTAVGCHLSYVQFSATVWTVACQAPLSMGFSQLGYRSGLPFPSPGDLPDPGIKPTSPASPALAGTLFTTSTT